MTHSRIQSILGPALVLYLLLDVGSRGAPLDWFEWVLAGLAIACSGAPHFVRSWAETEGARRTGVLGLACGVILAAGVRPDESTQLIVMSGVVAEAMAGALLLHLAFRVPDDLAIIRHSRMMSLAPQVLASCAAAMGILSHLEPLEWGGRSWFLPAAYHATSTAFLLIAATITLALRFMRRRWGSSPAALASNAWPLMGLVPAVVASWLLWVGEAYAVVSGDAVWVRLSMALLVLGAVLGHVALVDPGRRAHAGKGARALTSFGLATAMWTAGMWHYEESLSGLVYRWTALLPVVVLSVFVVEYLLRPAVFFVMAPFRGRLLKALAEIDAQQGVPGSLDELAANVLVPLRRASADRSSRPFLYSIEPYVEFRIDVGGAPMQRNVRVPDAILSRFAENPAAIIVSSTVEGQLVRHPGVRPLGEALRRLGALAVVPLVKEQEIEGVLVVPRGRRRTGLSLEETTGLYRLAERLTGQLSAWTAQSRAQSREGGLIAERDRAAATCEDLAAERDRYRQEIDMMRSGRGASRSQGVAIAYSGAMRRFMSSLKRFAVEDAPICLVAEGGVPVDRHARMVHQASGHAKGPLVTIDCTGVSAEDALGALIGRGGPEGSTSGWLRLAAQGTLMLADFPALSMPAQRALAEVLATRQVRPLEGGAVYSVQARVIVSSRKGLDALLEAGAANAGLAARMKPAELRVPPLRERLEDIESITLLAVDRACRVHGRDSVGISEEVQAMFMSYPWPGNLRELQHVVDRAVSRCAGPRLEVGDLPQLGHLTNEGESFADIERRVLEEALWAAGGNQSEAARRLSLKRSTFADKLRRLGISASRRGGAGSSGGSNNNEDAA